MIPQQTLTLFLHCVHGAIFSTPLCWQLGGGEKSGLSRSIFYTKFCSSVWNMDAVLSDPVCSTPNIYARYCDFMWTSCPFSAKTCREKIATERMDTVPCFNVICHFCRIIRGYLWKKITACSPSFSLPIHTGSQRHYITMLCYIFVLTLRIGRYKKILKTFRK